VVEVSELDDVMTVDEVMRLWPGTIAVFIRYRLHCVGCAIGRLHTVEEACRAHGLDRQTFMADLQQSLRERPRSAQAQMEAGLPSAIISNL